jgi:hypothetical protein
VNYIDGDPSKGFRGLYGYAISAKRYCLFEGKKARNIVDAKAHGIGYLMSPIRRKGDEQGDQFAAAFVHSGRTIRQRIRDLPEKGWLVSARSHSG